MIKQLLLQTISIAIVGSEPTDPGECAPCPLQYPSADDCSHHDASDHGSRHGYVSLCEEDGSPRHSKVEQVRVSRFIIGDALFLCMKLLPWLSSRSVVLVLYTTITSWRLTVFVISANSEPKFQY